MNTLSVRLAIGLAMACASLAAAVETAPPPRLVQRTPAQEQARTYRALFEKVGRAGLPELAKSKDTGLALQASWELHKKIVKRAEKGLHGDQGTYDRYEVKKFLSALKERTGAPVPEWWRATISGLEIDLEWRTFHLVDSRTYLDHRAKQRIPGTKQAKIGDREFSVCGEVSLTLDGETVAYKSGDFSLELPKDFLRGGVWDALADATVNKTVCLAPYTTYGGFGFTIAGFEASNSKRLWEVKSWATGRRVIIGATADHRVELIAKGDTLFVFGAELLGMYVEGFDLATGKCRFRFCTSYWDHFSEKWDIK